MQFNGVLILIIPPLLKGGIPLFGKLNVSHKSAAGHKEGGITGAIEALA